MCGCENGSSVLFRVENPPEQSKNLILKMAVVIVIADVLMLV